MIKNSNKNIVVVGGGYIGAVLSAVIAEKGAEVTVIDINQKIIDSYKKGESPVEEPGLNELIKKVVLSGNLKASTEYSAIKKADAVLVTVGTPLNEDGTANKFAIHSAVSSIKEYVCDGQLIIVKSTVPPFTTENDVAIPLRKKAKVHVAFCPERLAEGNAIFECKNIPVVIGGVDEESNKKAKDFWEEYLGIKSIVLSNSRSAELVKLADNAWIDLNIALAFELAKVSDNLNIDVLEVIKAANSLPKGNSLVNILLPSIGVGGYCLTKDPLFLNAFSKLFNSNFETALTSRKVNEESPHYAMNRLHNTLINSFKEQRPEEMKITILGLSFKSNTGDCRFTPTIPAIKKLKEYGYQLKTFDNYISNEDYKLFKNVERSNSIDEALEDAHAVAFFTGHEEFKSISLEKLKQKLRSGAVIFDGRMFFTKERINEFKNAGFIFKGVGR